MQLPKLALQLWTVREELRRDPRQTLDRVRALGFDVVELAGYGALGYDDFRRLCDDRSFRVIGNHQGPLRSAQLDQAVSEMCTHAKAFRSKFAVVPMDIEGSNQFGREAYLEYAKLCDLAGKSLRNEGLSLCLHCYHFDLVNLKDDPRGASGLDILLENTSPDHLSVELDTFFMWPSMIPIETVLRSCGARCKLFHVDDYSNGKAAPLGRGAIKWGEVLPLIQESCTPDSFILEHRSDTPFEWVQQSSSYWSTLQG